MKLLRGVAAAVALILLLAAAPWALASWGRLGDLAAIDCSFGVLAEFDVADREAGARAEHLARIWQVGSAGVDA